MINEKEQKQLKLLYMISISVVKLYCSVPVHPERAKVSYFWTLDLKWWYLKMVFFNPFHPNVRMHILHTAYYTFPKVLIRRICLTIKSFLVGDYFL